MSASPLRFARWRRVRSSVRKAKPSALSTSGRGVDRSMTVVEDAPPADTFSRAGLPRETVAAWLASGGALAGDYRRDSENVSRQWRIGAELLAKLPPKPKRSQA